MNIRKENLILYAVTDRTWLNGDTLYNQVEKALKGGITLLQLREKNLCKEEFLKEALQIKKLCKRYSVPLIINDNVDIARTVDADGVHLGQKDMDIKTAREILGNNKIIGVSARTVEQAVKAENDGADYLGVGAVFGTGTKKDAMPLDHKTLKDICSAVTIPVVAIGGINRDNIPALTGSGICGVAVVSGIFKEKDITAATEELKKITEKILKR